ncbi:MAG: glycosyltransferase [Candidatus Competibacteraceae bacterium]|nr:glycosyltransferase [Candidatus Competibacteraceae bacterium]
MKAKNLHIVAFDIPFPPTYGGVIDIFHKIRHLHKQGIQIYLHAFEYNRIQAPELAAYCKEVYYYPRKKPIRLLFHSLPFIVATRIHADLEGNLEKDDYPILFEGLHTCGSLLNPNIRSKQCIVRTHNIEHQYYHALATHHTTSIKRWYYKKEAHKLASFEKILQDATGIAAISPNDTTYFNHLYGKTKWIPPFHPEDHVISSNGTGDYALYHGNLKIEENNRAALYLVEQIFSKTDFPLVIAGQNPSLILRKAIAKHKHIRWIAPESQSQMNALINDAQLHVLPSFQSTGIKLKLLHSLYKGRFCIVNPTMIEGTGLDNLCVIANEPQSWIHQISHYRNAIFDEQEKQKRVEGLRAYDNKCAAEQLIQLLWPNQ